MYNMLYFFNQNKMDFTLINIKKRIISCNLISLLKDLAYKHPLAILLVFVFVLRFLLSYFTPYIIAPDQIYQTLEPAHRLVYGHGFIAWEWVSGIRSWLYPGFLALIMKLCSYISSSSRFYMAVISSVMILFSLIPIYVTYKLIELKLGRKLAIIGSLIPAFFYILTYYSFATLNGVIPAYLFIYAIYLIIFHRDSKLSKSSLIFIGILFGFIVTLRFHLLPEVCIAILYCCWKDFKYSFKNILLGFLIIFIPLCGILDWLTLGYPFQSIIKNIDLNIFHGVANSYGKDPIYSYLLCLIRSYNLFLVPICFLAYKGFRKYPLIMLVGIINFISFSFISHKEFRFIFLFNICICSSAGIGFAFLLEYLFNKYKGEQIKSNLKNFFELYCLIFIFILTFIFASIFLGIAKSKNQSLLFDLKLNSYINKNISGRVSLIYQFNSFDRDDVYCGGGYSYLGVNIPYSSIDRNCDISNDSYSFFSKNQSNNLIKAKTKVIIVPKDKWIIGGQKIYCSNGYCAYSYPRKISFTDYYLFKILPFLI